MSTGKKRAKRKASDEAAGNGSSKSREIRASRRQSSTTSEDVLEWTRRMAKEHPLLLVGAGVLAGGVALRMAGIAARIPLLRGLVAGSVVSGLAGWSGDAIEKVRARLSRS
jgi:hypothetical protein